MNFTRRGFVTVLSLSVAAIGLAGCTSSAADDPEKSGGNAPAPEAGAFPVTIEHKFGSTEITAAPARVVTVGLKEQDDLLALGIVPVGATHWLELENEKVIGPWAGAALGTSPVPTVLEFQDGIEFEKIASLAPDLIIALYSGITAEDYEKLTKIAPVVAQPKDTIDYGVSWQVQAATVGKAVGQSAKMAELIKTAEDAIVAAKKPAYSGLSAVVATEYEGIYVYGSQDPRSRLLTELGFSLPKDLDKATGTEFGGNISEEDLGLLDTDLAIWFATPESRASIEGRGLYKKLKVHTEGRGLFIKTGDKVENAFSFVTVLSLPYLVENLTPRIDAAVDGDPTTSSDQA